MDKDRLTLTILPGRFAVCRLAPTDDIPAWAMRSAPFTITRTADELSIACAEANVPAGTRCVQGLRALKLEGPMDLSMVGILASLAVPLARADISLFAVSTFDTDYLLVTDQNLEKTVVVLSESGHEVRTQN